MTALALPSGLLDFSKDWRDVYPPVYPQWSFIQVLAGVERGDLRTVHTAIATTRNQALNPKLNLTLKVSLLFFLKREKMANI